MRVWRLCSRRYEQTAFSGDGAAKYGGRWNPKGIRVVYTSESVALTVLERLPTLLARQMPLDYVAIPVSIPDGLSIETLAVADLPKTWRDARVPTQLPRLGEQWFHQGHSAVLKVPSAVVELEHNYLLNPTHADFTKIRIGPARPFAFDARLWRRP